MLKRFFFLCLLSLLLLPVTLYASFPLWQGMLEAQFAEQYRTNCQAQTAAHPSMFPPERPEIAEQYCQCITDGVVLTRSDVAALIRRQPPEALNARIDAQVGICSEQQASPAAADAQVIYF